jgi:hypothetical protein
MTYRHRMVARDSPEMANLWEWSRQFQGEPGYMHADLQILRRENAVRREVERLGGRGTKQDRVAVPTKDQLTFFRMTWG